MSILVIVLLISQGHPGVLLAPGKDFNDFFNDPNFYRVVTASSPYPRHVQDLCRFKASHPLNLPEIISHPTDLLSSSQVNEISIIN